MTMSYYKAGLHTHTIRSDGQRSLVSVVEEHYRKGYEILAITDHVTHNINWLQNFTWGVDGSATGGQNDVGMTVERYNEITCGIGRGGRGMLCIPDSWEAGDTNHWPVFMTPGATNLAGVASANGRAHQAHAAWSNIGAGSFTTWLANSVFSGLEIMTDGPDAFRPPSPFGTPLQRRWDRALWSELLVATLPSGRNVFGFANDDSHDNHRVGTSWVMMEMNALTVAEFRLCMDEGRFYCVSRRAVEEGINIFPGVDQTTGDFPLVNAMAPHMGDTVPVIDSIVPTNSSITINARNYSRIDWIGEGFSASPNFVPHVIHSGSSITVTQATTAGAGSFVRANIIGIGNNSIAFTQAYRLHNGEFSFPTRVS
jgi:hypothetical protein